MGLVDIALDDLKRLLSAVHSGDLPCPLTPDALACQGFQDMSDALLGALRHLDENAVRALLVAVIAERLATPNDTLGNA